MSHAPVVKLCHGPRLGRGEEQRYPGQVSGNAIVFPEIYRGDDRPAKLHP